MTLDDRNEIRTMMQECVSSIHVKIDGVNSRLDKVNGHISDIIENQNKGRLVIQEFRDFKEVANPKINKIENIEKAVAENVIEKKTLIKVFVLGVSLPACAWMIVQLVEWFAK